MIHPVMNTEKVTIAAGAATEVAINCRSFLIKNNSTNTTVYFREVQDGVAATADNGFALSPGETLEVPLCVHTLSLFAAAEADVRLLYIGEGW